MHLRRQMSRFGVLLATVASCGGVEIERPREPSGTNVLLISLDSTRRDLLGCYGRRPVHAPELSTCPRIDGLAAEGVLFERAYATTSWTLPSHASILTGQPELAHAVELDPHRLGNRHPTLAQLLAADGYRTAGFFTGPYLDARFGFGRGFERYEACYGRELSAAARRAAEARSRFDALEEGTEGDEADARWDDYAEAMKWVDSASHRDVSSSAVTEAALAELDAAAEDGRPFFLFVHYFDPHYDYVPPAPHDTRFDPDYTGSIDGVDFYDNPKVSLHEEKEPGGRVRTISDRDLEHVLALYEGELEWTDLQVGRLLDRLGELGFADDTLIVVTADHGDEFFEHGSIGHRRTLFEEVVQVPLVVRLPGVLPAGERVEEPVSTVAIVPTVLDLLGLERPAELAGQGLLERVEGRDGAPGVFGRFVGRLVVGLGIRGVEEQVMAEHFTVLETYLRWPIKVTRRKQWVRPPADAPATTRAAIELQNESRWGREELSWIDLERSPGEAPEHVSRDFDDPRARAALAEFHDRYRELVRLRDTPGRAEGDAAALAMLRGLGYGGEETTDTAAESDEFVLPPPGEGLLRRESR